MGDGVLADLGAGRNWVALATHMSGCAGGSWAARDSRLAGGELGPGCRYRLTAGIDCERMRSIRADRRPGRTEDSDMNDSDTWAVINALHVAAVVYATDAAVNVAYPRVQQAFLDQATNANRIADELEAAQP